MPQLSVRRGRAAVEFYKAAFGAVEDYRVGGTDESEDVVAQLSVGDASFWVADESPPHRNFSPESLGGATVRMLLIVEDPASAVVRAIAAGAKEVYPVGEEHGWRLGRVEDPFGHHWEIGTPLVAWPPAKLNAEQHLRALYDGFNARDVDSVLAALAVDVHQTVRGLDGQVLGEGRVCHVYELRDGLVMRMDVEELAEGS